MRPGPWLGFGNDRCGRFNGGLAWGGVAFFNRDRCRILYHRHRCLLFIRIIVNMRTIHFGRSLDRLL